MPRKIYSKMIGDVGHQILILRVAVKHSQAKCHYYHYAITYNNRYTVSIIIVLLTMMICKKCGGSIFIVMILSSAAYFRSSVTDLSYTSKHTEYLITF